MQIIDYSPNSEHTELTAILHDYPNAIFFDIETTGFAPATSILYLIGVAYIDEEGIHTKQWFADSAEDETDVINAFLSFISNYSYLIHFNGEGFDIPYIIKKCNVLGINCNLNGIISIDIYKLLSPLKNLLKLINLKQKSVEQFIGIDREDKYSGGELIKVYHEYRMNRKAELLTLLLLHNREDIEGMISIYQTINYCKMFEGEYEIAAISIDNSQTASGVPIKELIIEATLNNPVPVRISKSREAFYFTAYGNTMKFSIIIYTDELKYYYPNYKDYYYLPMEDRAIHKSVAFYVDKEYRTKAKAADCYSKKTGTFLPQYSTLFEPYFKIDYMDTITYFELTDDFIKNKDQLKEYSLHILSFLNHK